MNARMAPRPGSSGEYRVRRRPVSSPSVIPAAPPSVSVYLDRAVETDVRGWCADCDEAPGEDLCHTHQATVEDATLIGSLRKAIAGVSESEMAALLAGTEAAA